MLVSDYNTTFNNYIHKQDLESAYDKMISELGSLLITNKSDFIDMLNESGIEADESMPKNQLIELFTANTDNKQMLLGASLLINQHNQTNGFDGEKQISDEGVKLGYAVLNENFNSDEQEEVGDEEFSYIAPLIAGLVKGGAALWRNKRKQSKATKPDVNEERIRRQELAQIQLEQEMLRKQQEEIELKKQAQIQKRKKRVRTAIIASSIIGVAVITGIIIIVRLKRRKNG